MGTKIAKRTLGALAVASVTVLALHAPTAHAEAPKVKIGGIELLSGKYGSYGQQVARGMEIAAKEVNDAGGLPGGAQVELDIQDSGSDSAQAISLLRRFSGSSDVMAIVGPVGTPDLLAIMPLSPQAGLPIVSVASSTDFPPNRFGKWLVRVSLRETQDVIKAVLDHVGKARNIHTVGLLQDRTNDFAQAEANTVRKVLASGGMKLLGDEAFANGDKDFAAILDKVTRDKPDALWLAGFVNEVSLIMQQARARGYKGLFVGGGGLTDPTIAKLAQSAATGTITFLPFNSASDAPPTRKLVAGYKAVGGQGDVPTYTAYGYDAVMLLANAAKTANSTDRVKVMDALGSTKDLQLTTGTYTFAGKGDNVAAAAPFLVEIGPTGTFVPMQE